MSPRGHAVLRTPRTKAPYGQSVLLLLLGAGLAAGTLETSPALPTLSLTNFRREVLPSELTDFIDNSTVTKEAYFQRLKALGMTSGFQVSAATGLCPVASNGATLATPACLLAQDYRFAVFIGDSITREVAWSFARMAATASGDTCQRMGPPNERWMETKRDPSFKCAVNLGAGQRADLDPGGGICAAGAQQPHGESVPTSYDGRPTAGDERYTCCNSATFNMYFHDFDYDEEAVHAIVRRYRDRCKCKGLLWLGVGGLHRLLGQAAFYEQKEPLPLKPWTFPYGRDAGVRQLLAETQGGQWTVVLASTPKPVLDIMMLHPPKFDWPAFQQLDATRIWAAADRRAARDLGLIYAPYFETSVAFAGLQCDGIHFGNSWETVAGCAGFTSVTDLVMHQVLNQICHARAPVVVAHGGHHCARA